MNRPASGWALILTIVAAGAVAAQAQVPARVSPLRPLHSVQSSDYRSYSAGSYYYYRHPGWHPHVHWGGATAAGSYARGMASWTYAQGLYNRLTAEARVIHAEAQRLETENRQLAADTYFAMRQANAQARAALRGPRPTAEQAAHWARQAAPDRLSDGQLDARTGQIAWPLLLQQERFAPLRDAVESAFAHLAAEGRIPQDQSVIARQSAQAMLAELQQLVRQVQPADYIEADRFLRSLAYEAQLSVI